MENKISTFKNHNALTNKCALSLIVLFRIL